MSAIHKAIEKSASFISNAASTYVNNLETGLRSTFKFGNGLNGEFYVPTSLEDAQAHYILSPAVNAPLIFRINYSNSTFTKDEVSILMDLDLTQMDSFIPILNMVAHTTPVRSATFRNLSHPRPRRLASRM